MPALNLFSERKKTYAEVSQKLREKLIDSRRGEQR
jgi:SOS response regulatory protein OraA/RecX